MTADFPRPSDTFSDEPLSTPHDDAIGREQFVAGIVTLLERVGGHSASTVLAVVGQWGLGKSTVLTQVTERLRAMEKAERAWIVAEFNPWYYQDLPSLQTAFFRELSAVVPSGRGWRKLRRGLAGFAYAVAPLGAVGGLVGVDASGIGERVAELSRGDGGILSAKATVKKALLAGNRPVLMVIDDVDRLDPQELLLLFKLIRLAGRLPNVYYLLAYDEDTLLDALSRTGLIGPEPGRRAIDYMEKIVQIRIDLPPIRDEELGPWVDREVAALRDKFAETSDREVDQRFSEAYYGHIRARLRTPRAIKRFFAQVESMAASLGQEVDFVDFLVLSWIRSSEPLVYRAIIEQRSRLLGDLDVRARQWPGDKRDAATDRQYWIEVLDRARVEDFHVDGVADLLSQLFPRFADQWSGGRRGAVGAEHGRVSHRDYFDRYFAFGVPAGDISDLVVHRACNQILTGEPGAERTQIEVLWAARPDLVLSKIQRYWQPGMTNASGALRWMAERFAELPEDDHSRSNPRLQTTWFAQSLFTSLRNAGPREAIEVMANADPSLAFAERVVYVMRNDTAPPETRGEDFGAAKREFSNLVREKFDEQGDRNPLEYPDGVWGLFRTWASVGGDDARVWAREHLDRGSWSVLDLLAQMVSRTVAMGVPDAPVRVGELDLPLAHRVIGKDRIRVELADELRAGPVVETHRHLLANPDNRRAVALDALRRAIGEEEREIS